MLYPIEHKGAGWLKTSQERQGRDRCPARTTTGIAIDRA
jgi:hypothetical protein